jgi:EpsI family protein
MCLASVIAIVAEPTYKLAERRQSVNMQTMIPKQFGDWREEQLAVLQMVNPQTQELLDRLYSEVLVRTYVNSSGYRIMLSVAHGNQQRGDLQVHKPEVCYPAQGFVLQKSESGTLTTSFGSVPVRRLFTTMGARQEPLTYWTTVGDTPIRGQLHRRWVELSFGLTGKIPDGILFRVSSIDPDQGRAYGFQDQFVNQLLQAVSSVDRKRLSGLDDIKPGTVQ